MFTNTRFSRIGRTLGFVCIALVASACRSATPTNPPGADPTDPEAEAAPWKPGPNPYTTSAFEGETLTPSKGHEHHKHGGHKHGSHNRAPAATSSTHEHAKPDNTEGEQ